MKKVLVFEDVVYNADLEKELYYFCLKRQFSLINYLIAYFFYSFLYFFKVISKKKYYEKRWSFLDDVKDIDDKIAYFWESRKKKFATIVLDRKIVWISEYPEILLKNLAKQSQVELTANEYDISAKIFLCYEDVYHLYEKIVPGEKPQIYGKYHSKLKKVKDADFIIVYNDKIFVSGWKYWLNRALNTAYTFFMLLMMGLSLGLVSMYFGAAYYIMPMFLSYFSVDYLPFLNIFPVVFFIFLLYLIFNRVWVSFLLTAILTLGVTWVNYWKLFIRNDPLLAIDLTLFFESMEMAGEYDIQLDWKIIAVIIACVLGTLVAIFLVKGKIRSPRVRLIGIVALVLVGVYSFNNIYMDSSIYASKKNNDLINRWSATQVYISKGFIYPFIYSIKANIDEPPLGYNEKSAKEKLYSYDYTDIADNKKVNVISIMLEAYNDFSKFEDIEFNEDVYEYWHQLEAESYSGELVTNIFTAGTVNTEWSFLTGYTSLYNFRSNINSYARYFGEQNYTVEGSHPSYDWFYNRKNINEYLGFENYYYLENYYGKLANGQIARDNILFPEIVKLYEANKETGKPYFSFNVTYQNHGPYSLEKLNDVQYLKNKGYPEEEYNILNNYLSGINNTNQELKTFIDSFREEEEPVVVILFGDHNPWMGDNNSVYKTLGISFDLGTEEGFYNYYNTPYIIWGNDKAKEMLGNDLKGEGPTIGPYFLMNEFFELADYEGNEFMKISNELRADVDVVHTKGRYKESGVLTSELSSESEQKLTDFLQLQYFWRKNLK